VRPTSRRLEIASAAALFALLTIVFTWPVAARITTVVPSDFGDPLLNAWILAWDATHFGRGWWNANIFYPNPLALGYSEHLAAQAFSIAPVYWLTGNPILCYNLVFLATFLFSGLGVFLLAREFKVGVPAAVVAGVAYAFTPYRISALPHIQVLSSAWMPFVLLGFRRYFETSRTAWMVFAGAMWTLQNLSCGYYLLYFSPVVAIYIVWELCVRGLWTNPRVLASVAFTIAGVLLTTLPFLLPYLELRSLGFLPRSIAETRKFSADVYGYLTIDPNVRLWGSIMRAWPKAEGTLFPGFMVALLAAIGSVARARPVLKSVASRKMQGTGRTEGARGFSRAVPRSLVALAVLAKAIVIILLLGFTIRLPFIRITSLARTLVVVLLGAALVITTSRDARRGLLAWPSSAAGAFATITVFATVMSFGPEIRAMDRVVLDPNLYAFFYTYVPGFDGLRVPARFGMVVMLALAMLAGMGLQWFSNRAPSIYVLDRHVRPWWPCAICGVLIAVESFAAPIPVDGNSTDYTRQGLAPLPALQHAAPPVYDFIASLPADTVVVEFPLGEPAFDVRYMYYSVRHWRRLVNGYSGGMPPSYEQLDMALQDFMARPEYAWDVLKQHRPRYAVVHGTYYTGDRGENVISWLMSKGGTDVARFGSDRVFQLPVE